MVKAEIENVRTHRAGVLVTPTVPAAHHNHQCGWTVGAGIEGAIGGNWIAKLEYLYIDLGRVSGSFLTTSAALGGGVITSNFRSRITDNVLRVGVNYRFGGPVVAKY